jgi:hypothetical protein
MKACDSSQWERGLTAVEGGRKHLPAVDRRSSLTSIVHDGEERHARGLVIV